MTQPHPDGLNPQPSSFGWTQTGVGLGAGGAPHAGGQSPDFRCANREGLTRNGECAYLAEGALDDGVGPVAAGPGAAAGTPNELARAHHFGVVQMHQWAELAGGRLEIAPREPGGTEVRLVVSGR